MHGYRLLILLTLAGALWRAAQLLGRRGYRLFPVQCAGFILALGLTLTSPGLDTITAHRRLTVGVAGMLVALAASWSTAQSGPGSNRLPPPVKSAPASAPPPPTAPEASRRRAPAATFDLGQAPVLLLRAYDPDQTRAVSLHLLAHGTPVQSRRVEESDELIAHELWCRAEDGPPAIPLVIAADRTWQEETSPVRCPRCGDGMLAKVYADPADAPEVAEFHCRRCGTDLIL